MSTQLKRLSTDPTFYVVTLGYKSTLKTLRSGKAKLVIIAGNTPPLRTFLGVQFFSFRSTLGSVDYSIDMFQHSIRPIQQTVLTPKFFNPGKSELEYYSMLSKTNV